MQHAYKQTPYEQLEALPEGLAGEILNGQSHAQLRPSRQYASAESELTHDLIGSDGRGRGGSGGLEETEAQKQLLIASYRAMHGN